MNIDINTNGSGFSALNTGVLRFGFNRQGFFGNETAWLVKNSPNTPGNIIYGIRILNGYGNGVSLSSISATSDPGCLRCIKD